MANVAVDSTEVKGLVVSPVINVSDVLTSVRWFEALGWTRGDLYNAGGKLPAGRDSDDSGPATYAMIHFGHGQIFLSWDSQGLRGGVPPAAGSGDDVGATWEIWWVGTPAEVDEMHRRAVAAGVLVVSPPEVKPWQQYELRIAHPDGHVFRICSPLPVTAPTVEDPGPAVEEPRRLRIGLLGSGDRKNAKWTAWLQVQGEAVRIPRDTPVSAELLANYDIVIIDFLRRNYGADEARALEAWVSAGGRLMAMMGYAQAGLDAKRTNSLIGGLGLKYDFSKGLVSRAVKSWTSHPIGKGITSVTFEGGYPIAVADDGVGVNTVVARLPIGPVAVAQERNAGKVFLWGDEWIQLDSEWTKLPQVRKLWANIFAWLKP